MSDRPRNFHRFSLSPRALSRFPPPPPFFFVLFFFSSVAASAQMHACVVCTAAVADASACYKSVFQIFCCFFQCPTRGCLHEVYAYRHARLCVCVPVCVLAYTHKSPEGGGCTQSGVKTDVACVMTVSERQDKARQTVRARESACNMRV